VDIITQTETLYELVDERDHSVIAEALSASAPDSAAAAAAGAGLLRSASPSSLMSQAAAGGGGGDDGDGGVVSFVCRMNTAARGMRYVAAPIKPGFERTRASDRSQLRCALFHRLAVFVEPSEMVFPGPDFAKLLKIFPGSS